MKRTQEPAQGEAGAGGYWKRKYDQLRAETDDEIKQLKGVLAAEVRLRMAAEEREQQLLSAS